MQENGFVLQRLMEGHLSLIKKYENKFSPDVSFHEATVLYEETVTLRDEVLKFQNDVREWNMEVRKKKLRVNISKEVEEFTQVFRTCKVKYYEMKELHDLKCGDGESSRQERKPPAEIQIEPFDGTLVHYQDFITLFNELVHKNSKIPDIEKFYRLKSFLKGEAKACIDDIPLQDKNYTKAYDTLVQKYESKRKNEAWKVISNIIGFKDTRKRYALHEYWETHNEQLQFLNNITIPNLSELILFQLAFKNLTPKWKNEFIAQCTDPFDLKELLAFVDAQAKAKNKSTKKERRLPFNGCSFCLSKDHKLFFCRKFLDLDPASRYYFVAGCDKVCINCLNVHVSPCKSVFRCSTCDKPHNSLIHFKGIEDIEVRNDRASPKNVTYCLFNTVIG